MTFPVEDPEAHDESNEARPEPRRAEEERPIPAAGARGKGRVEQAPDESPTAFRAFVADTVAQVEQRVMSSDEALQRIDRYAERVRALLADDARMTFDLIRMEAAGRLRPIAFRNVETPPEASQAAAEDVRFLAEFHVKVKEIERNVRDGKGLGPLRDGEYNARLALNQLYYGTEDHPVVFPSDTAAEMATEFKNAAMALIGTAERGEPLPEIAVPLEIPAEPTASVPSTADAARRRRPPEATMGEVTAVEKRWSMGKSDVVSGFVTPPAPPSRVPLAPSPMEKRRGSEPMRAGPPTSVNPVVERLSQRRVPRTIVRRATDRQEMVSDDQILDVRPDPDASVEWKPSAARQPEPMRADTIPEPALRRDTVVDQPAAAQADTVAHRVTEADLRLDVEAQQQRFLRREQTEDEWRRWIGRTLALLANDDPELAAKREALFTEYDAVAGGDTEVIFTELPVTAVAASPMAPVARVERRSLSATDIALSEPMAVDKTAPVEVWKEPSERVAHAVARVAEATAPIEERVVARARNDGERQIVRRAVRAAGALLAVVLDSAAVNAVLERVRGGGEAGTTARPRAPVESQPNVTPPLPEEVRVPPPPKPEKMEKARKRARTPAPKPVASPRESSRPSREERPTAESMEKLLDRYEKVFTAVDGDLASVRAVFADPSSVPQRDAMRDAERVVGNADGLLRWYRKTADAVRQMVAQGTATERHRAFLAAFEQREREIRELQDKVLQWRPPSASSERAA